MSSFEDLKNPDILVPAAAVVSSFAGTVATAAYFNLRKKLGVMEDQVQSANERADSAESRLTESEGLVEELQHEIRHEPLTGLFTRKALEEDINERIDDAEETGTVFAVLFLDMDRFKLINDRLGHPIGDDALRAMGKTLKAALRTGEKAPINGQEHEDTDTVARMQINDEENDGNSARFGGDEFGVTVKLNGELAKSGRMSLEDQIEVIKTRIRELYAENLQLLCPDISDLIMKLKKETGEDIEFGASIGSAIYEPGSDADSLLLEADQNMYTDKQARKGQGPNRADDTRF